VAFHESGRGTLLEALVRNQESAAREAGQEEATMLWSGVSRCQSGRKGGLITKGVGQR